LATGSERGLQFGSEPRGPVGLVALCVWVVFLVFPLGNAIGHAEPALAHALSIVGAAAFVAAYVAIVIVFRMRLSTRWAPLLYVLVVLIAIALSVFDRPGWGFLFTYCAAGAAMIPPARFTLLSLALLTVLAGVAPALGGADGGTSIGFVASTAGIGLLMMLLRDLRVRNDELSSARAELARLAVAEERERFARDLHDLLGHTLSVIALKAELAGRLVGSRPSDAAREIAEVERVARGALGEVRDAVSGYRQPTLADELAGARMALSAAGVTVDVDALDVALDPGLEAVLAWAVREGATNVIRHSGASRCSVRVVVGLAEASVEVADDGGGAVGGGGSLPGHGLAGLRERAEALGGRVEAGPSAGGGFRLCVRVPVAAGPVDGGAGPADGAAGPADGAAGGLSSAAAAGAGAAPAVGS
jgi:two-component system sensor histidine kinase DesK